MPKMTHFGPKSARFPCKDANLPHCTYFTHIRGGGHQHVSDKAAEAASQLQACLDANNCLFLILRCRRFDDLLKQAGKDHTLEWKTECTKIAHRRSLAIFTADEGIAGNSAARTIFTHCLRRRNRGSLAIFFAEEITHLGASKTRAFFWGAVKNRRRSHRESRDFDALRN